MKKIDLDSWNRKGRFLAYQHVDYPYINLGADIDVTGLYRFAKDSSLSFYFSMVWCAWKISNEIPNFRYRFEDQEVFDMECNVLGVAHIPKGSEDFILFPASVKEDIFENVLETTLRATLGDQFADIMGPDGWAPEYIGCTCIPWVSYTHMIRTVTKMGKDCNPRLSWGKYYWVGDKLKMPFTVQVHHGLMDGYHVGQYFIKIQALLDSF